MHTWVRVCTRVCRCSTASAVVCFLSTEPPCPPPDAPDINVSSVAGGNSSRKAGWWFQVKASENPRASLMDLAENEPSCCLRTAMNLPHHGRPRSPPPIPAVSPRPVPAGSMDERPRSPAASVGRRVRCLEESVQASTAVSQVPPGESGH